MPQTKIKVNKETKAILKSQLTVQERRQALSGMHEARRQLDERAFYPAHDARKESPAYAKAHHKLVADEDRPCLACGVTNSILKDPHKKKDPSFNPYGAKQMETHHHVIEWALANAVDPEKFNQRILPRLRTRHPDAYKAAPDFTAEQVKQWVDSSEDNLWVLCDVHHRGKFFGIHSITDPIWGPQDILYDDFADTVRQTIQGSQGKSRVRAKSSRKGGKMKRR